MADSRRRAPGRPPRPDSEILDELGRIERGHDGPSARAPSLAEFASRRRWERLDREAVLRSDLRRLENLQAEHLKWLRISVRQFRAVLRLPPSADRTRRLAFARDAVEHNKESVRIWARKVADARSKLAGIRRQAAVVE